MPDPRSGGYTVFFGELPSVVAEGQTKAESIKNLADAYSFMQCDLNLE